MTYHWQDRWDWVVWELVSLLAVGPILEPSLSNVSCTQGRRVSRSNTHIRNGGRLKVNSLSVPMEHDPLSDSDNGLLSLVQSWQLCLNGISAIRHDGHSQMLSYIWSSQASLPFQLSTRDDDELSVMMLCLSFLKVELSCQDLALCKRLLESIARPDNYKRQFNS